MTEGAVLPPPPAFPVDYGSENPIYGFRYEGWEEIPIPKGPDWFPKEERYRRNANAAVYQEDGDPIAWKRYLTLGLFAFKECYQFEEIWKRREEDPLTFHRVIWYQFMFHVDKYIEVPETLNAWAIDITRPYLSDTDPTSLDMDTIVPWKDMQFTNPMEVDINNDWTQVTGKRRNRSPPKHNANLTDISKLTPLHRTQPKKMHELPLKPGTDPSMAARRDWNHYKKLVKPAAKEPGMKTVKETEEEIVNTSEDGTMEDLTMASREAASFAESIQLPRPPPFPNVSVNDGTHRVKIKWSIPEKFNQLISDPLKQKEAIHALLSILFQDHDGFMYRWQCDDLLLPALASTLSASEMRDYISPAITHIRSNAMLIFGVRFGFTENPIQWQLSDATKKTLKENTADITISNSSSTSGNLTTLGYVLLKAPNTTSTHRYTQYLRSKLPEATPYFDVVRMKKTPSDKVIPHLVVQCGEKHVTTVSQALLNFLTGKGTAVFLPRHALGSMSDLQVEKKFDNHHKWTRSLTALPLAPFVSHLDQARNEYYADGTVITRSTREWVASLQMNDGTPALCDAVNGTSDKKAVLLTPAPYLATATVELQQYKLRISPPSHREARFRDKVPPLPDVIHIQTAIRSNASFIDNLFSTEAWDGHNDEAAAKSGDTRSRKKSSKPSATKLPHRENAWKKPLISQGNEIPSTAPPVPASTSRSRGREHTAPTQHTAALLVRVNTVDEHSLTSTQGSTMASDPSIQAKLEAIEHATKEKFKTLQESNRKSTQKLQQLEKQLQRFDDVDRKLGTMETDIQSVARQLDSTVASQQNIVESIHAIKNSTTLQYNRLSSHLVTSGENVNHLTDAVTDIRNEMARLSHIMKDLVTNRYGEPPPTQTNSPTSVQLDVNVRRNDSCPTSQGHHNEVSVSRTTNRATSIPSQDSQEHSSPSITTENLCDQQPSRSFPHPGGLREAASQVPLPDSSSDNSIASTTSKTSHGSANTVVSVESGSSQASSAVRSPPPKKTRQGTIPSSPTRHPMHIDYDTEASEDQDVLFNGDVAMFDAVLTNALRTNLTSRFDDSVRTEADLPSTQDHGGHSQAQHQHQPSTATPTMETTYEDSSINCTALAPLNSRNNNQMSSDGAPTS